MMDYPGEHPEPHVDLNDREPLIHEISAGQSVFRLYNQRFNPLFYGKTGHNRFDAPDGSYGVLYAGMDEHCCFIETFGQTTGVRAVSGALLEESSLAELELIRPLKLIDLSAKNSLPRIGADARLLSGSHAIAQRWSAALRAHRSKPDGIRYPARHDLGRSACAIFESSATTFKTTPLGSLMEGRHRKLLAEILNGYDFGLI